MPSEITQLAMLESLALTGFSGSVPSDIGKLKKMEYLELKGHLTGTLPKSVGELTKLTHLTVRPYGFKSLTAKGFLDEVSKLEELEHLSLPGVAISGTIPESFSSLQKLEDLELWSCSLSGTIPEFVSELKSLTSLSFNRNDLEAPFQILL